MKRRVMAALVGLAGCRALIGIDDLEPEPPPPRNDGEGGASSGGGPGGRPAAGADASLATTCKAKGPDCRKCCKQSTQVLHDTFESPGSPGGNCVCEPRNCRDECSNDAGMCIPGPQSGMPQEGNPDGCIVCIDDTLTNRDEPCSAACNGEPGCLAAVKCMQECQ